MNNRNDYKIGIDDGEFIREKSIPMTKSEIRALIISKLMLSKNSRVLDVGSGSGSVCVECALLCDEGSLTAIEKDSSAMELTKRNAQKFGINNISFIGGEASAALSGLQPFDRIFIGGSGGKTEEIIDKAYQKLNERGRIVITAVLLKTLYLSLKQLEKSGFDNISFIQAQVNRSKSLGGEFSIQPMNPVFIISAEKGKINEC